MITLPSGLGTFAANGFGTWKSEPGKVGAAVRQALEAGYRHIDCAAIYQNEAEVGAVFADMFGGVNPTIKREDVWISSKVWCTCGSVEQVVAACRRSLADLKLDYLDEYLVHWPANFEFAGLPITDATAGFGSDGKPVWNRSNTLQTKWEGMEECSRLGLTKVRPDCCSSVDWGELAGPPERFAPRVALHREALWGVKVPASQVYDGRVSVC